jgi:hypothetical protein
VARYFVQTGKPRADDDYWEPSDPLMTSVTVCGHEAVDTGLIDKNGNAIMRAPNPMGFGRDSEW